MLEEPIIYPASKSKTVLVLLGEIGFVAVGFWLLLGVWIGGHVAVIGGASIVFFGLCGCFAVYSLVSNSPLSSSIATG